MNSAIIRRNIKSIRRSAGITQREMSCKLFMDERTYSKIENGVKKSLDVLLLASIADILNTNVGALLVEPVIKDGNISDPVEALIPEDVAPLERDQTSMLMELRELKEEVAELIRCHKQAIDLLKSSVHA